MPRININYLQSNLACYHYFDDGVVILKSHGTKQVRVEIKNGSMVKEITSTVEGNKKTRSVFIPSESFKVWENKKLITDERFNKKSIRTVTGIAKYIKELFGVKVKHIQKRTQTGGFCWEEVYWPSGKLMYRYTRGQSQGQFFRPDGSVWGVYKGVLSYRFLKDGCILGRLIWGRQRIKTLFEDGPSFADRIDCSFTWFNKFGLPRWHGEYKNGQRSGVWIINYVESVYIRGIAVPRSFADAKPEEIDVYKVVSERNAQIRAVLIDKIGIHRIINELNGQVIDEDAIKDYSLINIRLAADDDKSYRGDKIINLLKVKCPSTGAFYTLRVPPGIKDVVTARQWTFGVNIDFDSKINDDSLEFIKET